MANSRALSLSKTTMLMECMRYFASRIIRHVAQGGSLDEDSLGEIQKDSLAELKGTSVDGLDIAQQADFFRDCDRNLRSLMGAAISEGTK